jgi:hypothetical protein
MTWFADLLVCSDIASDERFKAVGWLEYGKPYVTGEVSEAFFRKLLAPLHDPWRPPWVISGHHICDLCQFAGRQLRGYVSSELNSSHALFVPGASVIYVSPVNLAHYIDAHRYWPPDEFVSAVLACPPMRSIG